MLWKINMFNQFLGDKYTYPGAKQTFLWNEGNNCIIIVFKFLMTVLKLLSDVFMNHLTGENFKTKRTTSWNLSKCKINVGTGQEHQHTLYRTPCVILPWVSSITSVGWNCMPICKIQTTKQFMSDFNQDDLFSIPVKLLCMLRN